MNVNIPLKAFNGENSILFGCTDSGMLQKNSGAIVCQSATFRALLRRTTFKMDLLFLELWGWTEPFGDSDVTDVPTHDFSV